MDAQTKILQLKNKHDENIRGIMELELDKVREHEPHWQDFESYAEYKKGYEKGYEKYINKLDAIRDKFESRMYLAWQTKGANDGRSAVITK